MKKIISMLLALIVLVGCFSGCSSKEPEGKTVDRFVYDDGISLNDTYNSDYFYRNDNIVEWFADPSCIYVSEEQDPEYGGWFYIYGTTRKTDNALLGVRTKDFATYESLGPVVIFEEDDWACGSVWAPEVILNPNPANENEKYLMYFSANSLDAVYNSSYDTFHLGLACAPTPAGPFVSYDKLHEGEENYYGVAYDRMKPSICFEDYMDNTVGLVDQYPYEGSTYPFMNSQAQHWAVIDAFPFFDEDGSMYLYYVGHADSYKSNGIIYGVKMIDINTPDYSTMRPIVVAGKDKIVFDPETQTYHASGTTASIDNAVNEGPYMQYHYTTLDDGTRVKKYYLTYSNPGYTSSRYSVDMATSDAPLGDFDKISDDVGRPTSGIGDDGWEHISGAAHHSIATAGDEMYIVYHVHAARSDAYSNPRAIAADRLVWQYNEKLGYDVYHANGPTWSLQPVPEVTSGMQNIASNAYVTVTNSKEGSNKELLTDGITTIHGYSDSVEFRADGSTVITLTFLQDYEISSLFVYNSRQYDYAFDKLASVKFYSGDVVYTAQDIAFNPDYVVAEREFIYPGSAAVMGFQPIVVNKIVIEINSKISTNSNTDIGIGDICVFGKEV